MLRYFLSYVNNVNNVKMLITCHVLLMFTGDLPFPGWKQRKRWELGVGQGRWRAWKGRMGGGGEGQ